MKILSATRATKQVLHRGPTRHKRYGWGWGVEFMCPDDLKKFLFVRPSKLVQAAALLTCNREVFSSNPVRHIDIPGQGITWFF